MSAKTQKILGKVKILCQPLLKFKPCTKIIYVFGSITRGDFRKGSDIDLIVVYDDTKAGASEESEKIEACMNQIQEKARKDKLNISFQKLMALSNWWDLVRDGEPWVVSSVENPRIIYDETGYLKLISKLVHKGHVYNRAEKSERLIERTYSYEIKNREIMLDAATELFLAGLEAAEIFLLSKGKVMFDPKKMAVELKKLGLKMADGFEDMIDIIEKINKGVLSEFSGKNIDHYQEKIRAFVGEIEDLISGK